MFTVPKEFLDDKQLELMLKEISFLLYKIFKFVDKKNHIIFKLTNFIIDMHQKHDAISNWSFVGVKIEQLNLLLSFFVSKDGLIFRDLECKLNNEPITETQLEKLSLSTNLLASLREKNKQLTKNFV